ncbi:hypothetical protein ACE1TH_06120 [Shouchella sp. JSM 1781072]|uniref:hypothetical protein n=1 Tax=Shouchella sp. JSM 1781072 TaxID=3344581 RepID=UPI0035C158AD
MSKGIIALIALTSAVVWYFVSREAMESSKDINWQKLMLLLLAGSVTTLIINILLFRNLSIF